MRIVARTDDGTLACFEAVDIQYSVERKTAYCQLPGLEYCWQLRNMDDLAYKSMVENLAAEGFCFVSKFPKVVAVDVPNDEDPFDEAEALL